MSNWIKAETSKTCPVMSSAFGLIYFGSYGCLKCDFNLGYDKEAGMIKCCYESSLKLEKKPDLREDLRANERENERERLFKRRYRRRIAFVVFITLSILFLFCVFVKHYIL